MSSSDLLAIFSLSVAISILLANYFQWWDITYDGQMKTRKWVKILFSICIILLFMAIILIIY